MVFRKNTQREDILFFHWKMGHTVKETSLLTGIPQGTISHYFARFSKHKEKFKDTKTGSQEPTRSTPSQVATSIFSLQEINKQLQMFFKKGEIEKARDYLQILILYQDLTKRFTSIIENWDGKKEEEIFKDLLIINNMFGVPSTSPTVENPKSDLTQQSEMNKASEKQQTPKEDYKKAYELLPIQNPPLNIDFLHLNTKDDFFLYGKEKEGQQLQPPKDIFELVDRLQKSQIDKNSKNKQPSNSKSKQ